MAVEVVLCKLVTFLSSYCGTSTSLNGNLGGEIRSHEMIRAKAELLYFKKKKRRVGDEEHSEFDLGLLIYSQVLFQVRIRLG